MIYFLLFGGFCFKNTFSKGAVIFFLTKKYIFVPHGESETEDYV